LLRLRAKALTYDDVRGKMAATKVPAHPVWGLGFGI
jgi:hypothetical protein